MSDGQVNRTKEKLKAIRGYACPVKFGCKVNEDKSNMLASPHISFPVLLDKLRKPGFSDDERRIMIHDSPKVLVNRKSE
jgi:hypothetical protein